METMDSIQMRNSLMSILKMTATQISEDWKAWKTRLKPKEISSLKILKGLVKRSPNLKIYLNLKYLHLKPKIKIPT